MREPSLKVIESKLIIDHRFIRICETCYTRRRPALYLPVSAALRGGGHRPLTDDGCVILTRQYRHPIGRIIYDLPVGRAEVQEPQQARAASYKRRPVIRLPNGRSWPI
jgi:hypothetical protein